MRVMCPECQGLPVRYKLVEDNTWVGAHLEPVICQKCHGEGQIEKDRVLDSYIDKFRFIIFK